MLNLINNSSIVSTSQVLLLKNILLPIQRYTNSNPYYFSLIWQKNQKEEEFWDAPSLAFLPHIGRLISNVFLVLVNKQITEVVESIFLPR
jgi:hypothetical protein